MPADRTTLALPIDVARQFDSTVSQTRIAGNTFQNSPDDTDLIASMLEDAEHEFRDATDRKFGTSRVGLPGRRETFETLTYDVAGHQAFKRNWTGVTGDYRPTERTLSLDKGRILPFDADAGDAAFIYRGLRGGGDRWEDVTDDRGTLWDILDYTSGEMVIHPTELHRAMLSGRQGVTLAGGSQLREVRIAISYRYGGLGGSSDSATATELAADLTDTETGAVAVADGARFPSDGTKILRIGREYVLATLDPAGDAMEITERGVRGTTAAAHSSGDTVGYVPPSVRKAVAARAGMQLVQAGRYSDWLPDTDDALDKGDVLDELEATWDATVAALS